MLSKTKLQFAVKNLIKTLLFFLLITQISFAQWYRQNSGITVTLYSVQFLDANNGFAVGDSGTIIFTNDGGTTWQKQRSRTVNRLEDIFFSDKKHGWAVSDPGSILHTSNGGIDWIIQRPALSEPASVFFVDSLRGWIVGCDYNYDAGYPNPQSKILGTNDGGVTWITQFSGELATTMNSVFFIDSLNGWAGGSTLEIPDVKPPLLKTTNGGAEWDPVTNISESYSMYCIYFSDIKNGWISGRSLYNTKNGGVDWIKDSSIDFDKEIYASLKFTNQNNGWMVGNIYITSINSSIAHTNNGGRDWSTRYFGNDTVLFSGDFIDSLTGWVVGENGLILHTTNAGVTFVGDEKIDQMPTNYNLSQNYPNPFNPSTTIKYSIPKQSYVTLKVYDLLGREVAALVNEEKHAGNYEIEFNTQQTTNNKQLASGIYFYQIKAGSYVSTKKMILLK